MERKYNLLVKRYTQVSEFVQESTDSVRTTKAYVGGEKQYNEFFSDFLHPFTGLNMVIIPLLHGASVIVSYLLSKGNMPIAPAGNA